VAIPPGLYVEINFLLVPPYKIDTQVCALGQIAHLGEIKNIFPAGPGRSRISE